MMKWSDVSIGARERERLEQTLGADEELRLLLRPRPEPDPNDGVTERRLERVISWIFLLMCLGITVKMAQVNPLSCILMLPAWAAGALGLCLPRLRRRRRLNTLYVITDRRVLMWEPNRCMITRFRSYPLRGGMVQEVGCKPGGYGNLVFAYAWDEMNGAREERVARQLGFIDIPQVKYVQAVLEKAIAEYEQKYHVSDR
ncbi:MAG: hypothetical protein Q4F35_08220 [Akkermansia sp.]|nr:hypothetical protein [Akkermansia sp.]